MKKIFALLLALLMLVSAIPFAAADAVECANNPVGIHEENEKGFCGWCGKQMHVCSEKNSHIYENGKCIHCGAEEVVAPEEPEVECDKNPVGTTHVENAEGFCGWCGKQLHVCSERNAHIYKDGACIHCGKTEPSDPIGPGADDEDDEDDSTCAHKYTTNFYKPYNDTYHYRKCSVCKENVKTKHTFNSYDECTKCGYEKKGEYRITLKESGKGDTKLSDRYANKGEYVYIYVDPDRNQKVDDIEVYARYNSNYKCTCTKYKTCTNCKKYSYNDYMDCDFFEFSRYYGSTSTKYYSKDIAVLKRSSSCYYFRMPASDVTVEVTYTGSSKYDSNDAYGNYTDVASGDWFYSAVNYVTNYEIMPGTSYTKFSPNVNMDRATVALALYNISGAKASGSEKFSDVDSYDWFYDAVVWCSSKGIIEGWNGKFDPYGEVTREDFAVMMHRYAEYKRYNTKASEDLGEFSDADKVSNYAAEALEWAVAEGLINGMGNGTLAPQGTTTRAQAAAVLMRFCKNVK